MEGVAISKAIEAAIAKNGGKVPEDIKVFRKSVRDELEGLKNVDDGGITPPLNYAGHQGTTQARLAVIKGGKYVPIGDWIDAQ
jgi:branched-chain amino acid transport system substrate-binding protein